MSQQQQITSNEWWSFSLFRLLGYGLLILALFDIVDTFYPARFMSATWEFQMIGSMVERVPVPLIGLWLVFYGKEDYREDWEKIVLKCLSWVSLVAGIFFLLLIPLGVNAAMRLNYQNEFQINAQVEQQRSQLQQFQTQLNNASTAELTNFASRLNNQGNSPEIKDAQDPEKFKTQLSSEIAKAEQTLNAQSTTARANQRQALAKSAIKWFLGATVSSILFIRLWQETRWARRRKKWSY